MELTKWQREWIGRLAALVLCVLLLWGTYYAGKAAAWAGAQERLDEAQRSSSSDGDEMRISDLLWLACGVLAICGAACAAIAVLPASVIYRIRPTPPTLRTNPEPSQIHRF